MQRPPLILMGVLIAVAIVARFSLEASTDVSWLITVGEHFLNGERIYRDVIEVNPPMSFLAYVPALVLSRLLHVRAEITNDALILLAIGTALVISARIVRRTTILNGIDTAIFLPATFAVLAILPMREFGQREHIAVISMLPWLALTAARAAGAKPSSWAVWIGGIGAGTTLMFKPHFVIAIGVALIALAILMRSSRVLFRPEAFLAAAIVVAYGIFAAIVFPDFFESNLALVRDVYLKVTQPFLRMLTNPAMLIWLGVIVLIGLMRDKAIARPLTLLVAGSLGFMIVFLIQRRGWPYHSYPMLALAFIALAYAASFRQRVSPVAVRGAVVAAFITLLSGGSLVWFTQLYSARALYAPVAALGPKPKILALTEEGGVGFPLTRTLGGEWILRQQPLLIAPYAAYIRGHETLSPVASEALDGHVRRERGRLIADIKRNPPNVVLVDTESIWSQILKTDPELNQLLQPMQLVSTVNEIEIFRRPDPAK